MRSSEMFLKYWLYLTLAHLLPPCDWLVLRHVTTHHTATSGGQSHHIGHSQNEHRLAYWYRLQWRLGPSCGECGAEEFIFKGVADHFGKKSWVCFLCTCQTCQIRHFNINVPRCKHTWLFKGMGDDTDWFNSCYIQNTLMIKRPSTTPLHPEP